MKNGIRIKSKIRPTGGNQIRYLLQNAEIKKKRLHDDTTITAKNCQGLSPNPLLVMQVNGTPLPY